MEEQMKEMDYIKAMVQKKCCANDCLSKLSVDTIYATREQCHDLQLRCDQHVNHLHLLLLGHFDACLHDSDKTLSKKHKNTDRSRTRLVSTFHGIPVCIDAFHFLHDISRRTTRDLRLQFEQHGLEPKMHGNVIKTSQSKALPFEVRDHAVKFIENYALVNALVLPGRTAGMKNPDVLVLPCGTTKTKVHELYVQACADKHAMSYSLFCETWNKFLPGVCIQKPRTDLCAVCKQDTMKLQKLKSLDEEAREEVLTRSLKHLSLVAQQRDHYKSSIAQSYHTIPEGLQFGDAVGTAVKLHFSFDFAQQIFIPNSSQQVGPLYFLVPYKLALFGIMCEPLSRMVMYVIPEAALVSKGSNMVISLLHHFLLKYGGGVNQIFLNADNCVGQNKNNSVLQYMMWRVATGMNSSIELAFMVAGHTKFSPDYGFGIFKRLYRNADVNSIEDVCNLISRSKLLMAEPVGTEQGDVLIPCFDWQSKFVSLGKVLGIKQLHHFAFDASKPGLCLVRDYAQSPVHEVSVNWHGEPMSSQLPQVLVPPRLTQARQVYLFTKIRPYVADEFKDRVCPKPVEVEAVDEVEQPSCSTNEQLTDKAAIKPKQHTEKAKSKQSVAAKQSVSTRSAPLPIAEPLPAPSGKSVQKRAPPTCSYCRVQGHRDAVRSGKSLCPKRTLDSSND